MARTFAQRPHVLVKIDGLPSVSDYLSGPFRIQNFIGKGHNPEAFRLSEGRVVVYVIC